MKEKLDKTVRSAKDFFQKTTDRAKQKQMPAFFKNTAAAFAVLWEKVKLFLKSGADFTPPAKEKIVSFVLKWWHWLLGGVFAFVVLYYPAGALLYHRIDLNPRFGAETQGKQSQSLNTLAELIDREIDKHAFTPNLPFFSRPPFWTICRLFRRELLTARKKRPLSSPALIRRRNH